MFARRAPPYHLRQSINTARFLSQRPKSTDKLVRTSETPDSGGGCGQKKADRQEQ
jgi:hypothetical protein